MKDASREQAIRDVQHFGEEGGVVPVIDVASTSTFLRPADMERTFHGELEGCYLYSRHSNPTVNAFGAKMAALEGTESALGVASGMAAIACTIEQILNDGGRAPVHSRGDGDIHIISSRTVYGGTYALFEHILPRRGWGTRFVDTSDLAQVERAITPATRILYTETLSNPLLNVSDLRALGGLARKHGLTLVVDNTFTPLVVSPIRFGADVVVHSCTKYISGSSDLIAGAIAASGDFIGSLIDVNHGSVMLTGPVMDPRIAHELYLRLDHLGVRMAAHSRMAQYLAERMEAEGIRVIYPGLASHPQQKLLEEMMNREYGFGGMLTVDCGTTARATNLAARLQQEKFGLYAVSLGFSRTLMSCPAKSTSSEIPEEEQKEMNLSPGLLRFSIGYTGSAEEMWQRFLKCYRELPSDA